MQFELKQNPAPNEWSVLIWKFVDGKKELDACALFTGIRSHQLAVDYRDLMISLENGMASIVLNHSRSEKVNLASLQHK